MADQAIGELIQAQSIGPEDRFVLEQSNVAKCLKGQVLLNWLTAAADSHGGIQSIVKHSTSGLKDTYRITLADTTIFDFVVTNGRSITKIELTKTVNLVDTHTITYNDGTTSTFTVTNGEKGDKGDTPHIWIRYASQKPTDSSPSFGLLPDDWMGQAVNYNDTAPTDWKEYEWFEIKGEKGATGDPATLISAEVAYQVGDSGTIIPSGAWSASIPVVAQGKYLWTRIVQQFNTGNPVTAYTVSRMGMDGLGSVSSVCGVSPDPDGNVALTAEDVGAMPTSGGTMTGGINMNGQQLSGLNAPTSEDQAANKGYVDAVKTTAENALPKSGGTVTGPTYFKNGIRIADVTAGGSNAGYNVLAKITINQAYANKAFVLNLVSRTGFGKIVFSFKRTADTDPDIDYFYVNGMNVNAFIAKVGIGIWNLYMERKSSQVITITNLEQVNYANDVKISFLNEQVDILPDGAIEAKQIPLDPIDIYENISVPASEWASSANQIGAGFGYRAKVALTGVTASMVPDVYFSAADAVSGNFSPVAQSSSGGVYIYAASKPTAAITIPTIRLTK